MAALTYLLDKSAWVQAQYSGAIATRLADYMRAGAIAVCTVTALEVLYSAPNAAEYGKDHARLRGLPWHDLSDPRAAVELQQRLVSRGWHRTPIPDVIIAATAAEHSLVVLHYDDDYERLAEVAGFAHEWVIDRGTGQASTPEKSPSK